MTEFEINLNDLLVETFNSILKYEESLLKQITGAPVTVTEVHILEVIGRRECGLTMGEIASSLDVKMPTITVAVKKLAEKGYVSRATCADDSRRTIVTLTETGQKLDRAHAFFHRKMVRSLSGDFSESEREILLIAVKKLSEFFREKTN